MLREGFAMAGTASSFTKAGNEPMTETIDQQENDSHTDAGGRQGAGHSSNRMQCMEVWGGNCLVDRSFEMPGLNVWAYSRPYADSHEGGDVYYLSSCASGRITRLLLADVSGHGSEAADMAVGLRDLMRKNVNVVKQTRFIEGMNQQFMHLSGSGSFATAIVATYYQPTRRLTLCNAGHPSPLRFDRAAGKWSMIERPPVDKSVVTGTPLGVFDRARYPEAEFTLSAGDRLLLYSDALCESVNADGQVLGESGLLELTREISDRDSEALLPLLVQHVNEHQPGKQMGDDVTVILIEATDTSIRMSDNLLALFRLMRPVSDNTQLVGQQQV
jgi:hypothetical protein